MQRFRSALIFGAVLLLSVLWMCAGIRCALSRFAAGNCDEALLGLVMVFPGSIIVAIILGVLANLVIPGGASESRRILVGVIPLLLASLMAAVLLPALSREGRHEHPLSPTAGFWLVIGGLTLLFIFLFYLGRSARKTIPPLPRTPVQARLRIKRLERALKRLHFMRRRPEAVLAFLLGALAVLTAFVLVPAGASDPYEIFVLRALGYFFGIGYVILLGCFLKAVLTGQWAAYVDFYIRQTEDRLAQIKSVADQLSA